MAVFSIPEAFLHFVWRTRRFFPNQLKTTDGRQIRLVFPGHYNRDAGPDFLNARLYIEDTLWAGHIEVHVQASEWYAHGHADDPAYANVILHVVLVEDRPVFLPKGERLPCLELAHRIPEGTLRNYAFMARSLEQIPCHPFLPEVDPLHWTSWLDRLIIERLEYKTRQFQERLEQLRGDWEQLFFEKFAYGLGLRVNAHAMERLAAICPLNLLRKYRPQISQLEALLFGQAGLLDQIFEESYPQRLQVEYQFLSKKHQLVGLSTALWKYARMRPSGFPDLRIAQLAGLVNNGQWSFSNLLDLKELEEVVDWAAPLISSYWQDHYRLDTPSRHLPKSLGIQQLQVITINVLSPMLFLYGIQQQDNQYQERALAWLEACPPEDNRLIRSWPTLPLPLRSAFDSQAVIHLYKQYCTVRRCLDCQAGQVILNHGQEQRD